MTHMLTDEELSELEALEKAATPGPWGVYTETVPTPDDAKRELAALVDGSAFSGVLPMLTTNDLVCPAATGCGPQGEANAALIAAARNALPSLLAAARENARLRELLRPRGIEELEAENHSWMTREDALSHYLCAQANWNIVLDELPQLKADLRATRRELARARAALENVRKYAEQQQGEASSDGGYDSWDRVLVLTSEAEAERSEG